MLKSSLMCAGLVTALSLTSSVFAAGKKEAKASGTAGKSDSSCSFEIHGTDAMTYVTVVDGKEEKLTELKIPEKCRDAATTFTLKHVGKLPKAAMGHNFVVIDTTKQAAIVADGLKSGPTADYIPTTKDGVVGHTNTVGGGETSTVLTIPKGSFKKDVAYGFVCTFPGHAALMNGKITFADAPAKAVEAAKPAKAAEPAKADAKKTK